MENYRESFTEYVLAYMDAFEFYSFCNDENMGANQFTHMFLVAKRIKFVCIDVSQHMFCKGFSISIVFHQILPLPIRLRKLNFTHKIVRLFHVFGHASA